MRTPATVERPASFQVQPAAGKLQPSFQPKGEAGLAAMEAAITAAIPGDGGSLVAVRLGNGMVEYAVAFFSEAAHESFAGGFEPPEAFFNKFAAQQFAHGHEFWPGYLPPGFETKG